MRKIWMERLIENGGKTEKAWHLLWKPILKNLYLLQHILSLFVQFRNKLKETTEIHRTYGVIYKFLKEDLRLSYKRGSARLALSMDPKLKYQQAIFSCRMIKILESGDIIINVDESSYTRSIKTNYSWLPKRRMKPIMNTIWKGRARLIFGLCSDGNYIGLLGNNTTKADEFCWFLFLLAKFAEYSLQLKQEKITISMDNVPIHLAEKTRRTADLLNLRVDCLPPYSPNLAPVEWVFGMSKRRMAQWKGQKIINLDRNYGKTEIIESLKGVDSSVGRRIWAHFLEEAKECIQNFQNHAYQVELIKML